MTVEELNAFGADTAGGLARCFGNEALYLRLVKMVPDEAGFDTLKTAIEANDLDTAFSAAHALKGVLGNLSLTPMYETASAMTDLLRARTETDYAPMLADLLARREALRALCGA